MDLQEAQEILYKNGFLIENLEDKLKNAQNFNRKLAFDLLFEALKRDYNKVTMDIEKYDEDYAVFTSMLEAHKWGDSNCKYDYTVKTSKMF